VTNGGPEHSITMLGAPTSGKTTFLAALSIALARHKSEHGQDWNVIGADTASTQALVDLTMALNHHHRFPAATALAIERYRWLLVGQVLRDVRRGWLGKKQELEPIQIGLDLADASGELYSPSQSSNESRKELIDNLEHSRGIVFLFDPISEFERSDAFYYVFSVLAELAERMVSTPAFAGGSLPHHVAVCISKFDEPRVIATAENLDVLITADDDRFGFPRVSSDESRDFFIELCEQLDVGDAELVPQTLEKYFQKDRIKYFVTSAIGFYVDPRTKKYDPQDPQNQLPNQDRNKSQIRGSIHPINVVEPLMWLAGQLTGTETL
jgi:hypothetical protein